MKTEGELVQKVTLRGSAPKVQTQRIVKRESSPNAACSFGAAMSADGGLCKARKRVFDLKC